MFRNSHRKRIHGYRRHKEPQASQSVSYIADMHKTDPDTEPAQGPG